jgi:hypothetical protein
MLRPDKSAVSDNVLEEIRGTMLSVLEAHCGGAQLNVESDIVHAADLAGLWYLRPSLLQAIATKLPDTLAARELRNITALFVGHYPDPA